jgi:hypothetical protein
MIKVKVNTLELFRLWRSPLRNDELADALGVPRGTLWYLRQRFKLPARGKGNRVPSVTERDAPSPEEIEQRCEEIRAKWPEGEEERRRVGGGQQRWRIPSYAFDGRGCAFLEIAVD